MAIFTVNLNRLFQTTFGVVGYEIGKNIAARAKAALDYDPNKVSLISHPEVRKTSMLGTPIYEICSVQDSEGQIAYTLPDAMVIDIEERAEIVKTKITNRAGTVKEFINWDDAKLTFRGFIISYKTDAYPAGDVAAMREYLVAGHSIDIVSDILNQVYQIHSIVIESIKFPRLEGNPGVQPFVIEACSDNAVELLLAGDQAILNN